MARIKKHSGISLKDAIGDFLKSYHLDESLLQKQAIYSWEKVVGELVSRHTRKLTVRKGVLYVKVDSAALKTELSYSREKIRTALNKEVNADVISEIVIS